MPALKAPGLDRDTSMGTAYGNKATKSVRAQAAIGTAAADTLDLLRLKAGYRLSPADLALIVITVAGAALTADVGIAAVPGGKTTFVDADYFMAAKSMNAAAVLRGDRPLGSIVLDDDYYLRLGFGGITSVAELDLEAILDYEIVGVL